MMSHHDLAAIRGAVLIDEWVPATVLRVAESQESDMPAGPKPLSCA